MSNLILIDTAFVVALINTRDEYHQQALAWSYKVEAAPTIVTDAVLMEIAANLARGYKKEAITVIEKLMASAQVRLIHVTPSLFDRGFALYKQHVDKTWSLVDCISFVVMRDENITEALTLDHHFEQAGFVALLREE